MERHYHYAGFDIHVAVQACVSTIPCKLKMPHVGYTAVITITKSGASVLPDIHLSERDGRWLTSVAETLLAACTAGHRAVDQLLSGSRWR